MRFPSSWNFWSWEERRRVRKLWSRECTNHGGAWPLFTAEEWRIFSRLRLVPPIRPMTSCFTNFYFFGTPNIALLLGGSIGFFYFVRIFFSPAGHLTTSRILWWIVRNYSYVFRVDRS